MKQVVIVESKRTPIVSFLGILSSFSAPLLASLVIKDIRESTMINPYLINEVIESINACRFYWLRRLFIYNGSAL